MAIVSALLVLGPGLAEAKGRNFGSSGGGFHGAFRGGGHVAGVNRGSQVRRIGKKAIASTRSGNRRSNIIVHGSFGRRDNIIVHGPALRRNLLKQDRFDRLHRGRRRGNRVVYYDNFGSSRIGYENTIVVPQAEAAPAPQETPARPFEPKIIEIASLPRNDDGSIALAPQPGKLSKQASNCLTVKRQITVDGQAMDAFGKACMAPDGSWTLTPDG
jgi:hypothetical protein